MFGRIAKIAIASTCNELVEMDFADYVDFAAFLRVREAFSRFVAINLWERKRRTSGRNGSGEGDSELATGVWGAWNYRCA